MGGGSLSGMMGAPRGGRDIGELRKPMWAGGGTCLPKDERSHGAVEMGGG